MVEASLFFSLNIVIIFQFFFYDIFVDLCNREMEEYEDTAYLILK